MLITVGKAMKKPQPAVMMPISIKRRNANRINDQNADIRRNRDEICINSKSHVSDSRFQGLQVKSVVSCEP